MAKTITQAELAKHNQPGDLWLAVDGDVYDVSKFSKVHPGGAKILELLGGNDVSSEFYDLHRQDVLTKYQRLVIGRLEGGLVESLSSRKSKAEISKVPFSEFPAFQGQQSPYFKDSHRALLLSMRNFVDKELVPIATAADLSGEYPDRELQAKLCMNGMLLSRMGPGPWMKAAVSHGVQIPGGVRPEEFDYFHEMIAHQEISRLGLPGFIDGIGTGYLISVPAVFNFGTDAMRSTVGRELLTGEKWSALAISEPFAGSDVAGLRTTAIKTPDGKHYIVNGVKKWITEGCFSDYFVTAVRTGKSGGGGISVLLIPRGDGVATSQIRTTYSTCAGTALVMFSDCKVPVENLLGKENEGFKLIMYNFNHERWLIVQNLLGQCRVALADTFMWAKNRKIFGKNLIDQPVIRNKLASSVAALESVHCYNEALTYDMTVSHDGPTGQRLGGPIAMLKYQATRTALKIVDDTVQIFGGRGVTKTGMGAKVEGLKNYAKYAAVYGGSEEIMADLAIKQAMKNYPEHAKL